MGMGPQIGTLDLIRMMSADNWLFMTVHSNTYSNNASNAARYALCKLLTYLWTLPQ